MTNKRLLALLLWLCLLPLAGHAQDKPEREYIKPPINFDLTGPQHLPFKRYDNLVYHYGFGLPGEFIAQDAYSSLEDEEKVYDGRNWVSPDGKYLFFFQLKSPTYGSLAEEVEALPLYIDLIRPQVEADGGSNPRFVRDEVKLHDFPAGRMLENATQYDGTDEYGEAYLAITVYYDYYDELNEYIFGLTSFEASYVDMSALLRRIGQSISIQPIRLEMEAMP